LFSNDLKIVLSLENLEKILYTKIISQILIFITVKEHFYIHSYPKHFSQFLDFAKTVIPYK